MLRLETALCLPLIAAHLGMSGQSFFLANITLSTSGSMQPFSRGLTLGPCFEHERIVFHRWRFPPTMRMRVTVSNMFQSVARTGVRDKKVTEIEFHTILFVFCLH